MANNKNMHRVRLGNPEHVVDAERAKDLLANRMKFASKTLDPRDINHSVLSDGVYGPETLNQFGRDVHEAAYNFDETGRFGATADKLADKVINRLSNDGQFDKFTVESIAAMTPSFMEAVTKPESNDALKDALSNQPAADGNLYYVPIITYRKKYHAR